MQTKQDAEAAKCAFATTYGLVDVLGPLSGCSSPGAQHRTEPFECNLAADYYYPAFDHLRPRLAGASPSPTAPGATPLPPGVVPPPPAAVPPTPTSQPPTPPPAPGTAPPTSGPSTSGSTPLPSAPAPVVPLGEPSHSPREPMSGKFNLRRLSVHSPGTALYAGSRNSQNNSALARLYLSDGTWIPTGNLITGRVQAAAVRLQSGKGAHHLPTATMPFALATGCLVWTNPTLLLAVLITSGIDANGNALSSCELWDPLTNAWTPTGSLSTSYYAHHIVLLANGQVLVAGTDVVFTSATDVFDPNTGVWTLALMPVTRAGSTLSLVPGDPQNRGARPARAQPPAFAAALPVGAVSYLRLLCPQLSLLAATTAATTLPTATTRPATCSSIQRHICGQHTSQTK